MELTSSCHLHRNSGLGWVEHLHVPVDVDRDDEDVGILGESDGGLDVIGRYGAAKRGPQIDAGRFPLLRLSYTGQCLAGDHGGAKPQSQSRHSHFWPPQPLLELRSRRVKVNLECATISLPGGYLPVPRPFTLRHAAPTTARRH